MSSSGIERSHYIFSLGWQDFGPISLQNRRNFLRILGEQRRKQGERETRATREGRSANIRKKITPVLQAMDR